MSLAETVSPSVLIEQVCNWLVEAAMPLWFESGVDRVHGGFQEALSFDGLPIAGQDKRVRVQARQIYTASHASVLGLAANALDVAHHGYKFLTSRAWHRENGWVHLLSAAGEVRDPKRDTYDHAFVLLALGWYFRASRDRSALEWIERTVEALDTVLADGTGAYFESQPAVLPRRQNPHMHCFEAMLALYEATGEASFLDRAKHLHSLVQDRFFDPKSGTLREFYGNDWRPLPGNDGDIVEPGHHCEWVWLLDKFERLASIDTNVLRKVLFDFAMTYGRHPDSGLLVDQVAIDGRIRLASQRLWPQTEAIKALLTRVESGDVSNWKAIGSFATGLANRFLETNPRGLWHDHFAADGLLLSRHVPASSLYHLFVAYAELMRVGQRKRSIPS